MKTYTFLIGTTDDFESIDKLIEHFEARSAGEFVTYVYTYGNCAAYEFEAPESCDQETVTLIGRGIAYSNDWCMDGTYSCVIDGLISTARATDNRV